MKAILKMLDRLSLPPLVPWCVFFCLGILTEDHLKIPFGVLYKVTALFLFFGAVFLRKPRLSTAILLVIAFFLGSSALARSKILPFCSIARIAPAKKEIATLRGIVVCDPVAWKGKTSFVLEASDLICDGIDYRVCGKVFVQGPAAASYAYGDELIMKGGLFRPFGFFRYKGVDAVLTVKQDGLLARKREKRGNPVKSFAFRLKHKAERIIASHLSPPAASVLEALLLGERQGVVGPVKEMMIKTGTWHVMVVSGSHTALVAFILLVFFKMLRIPRSPRMCLIMGLLVIYCILTGASSPVVRATVMAIALLTSYLIERRPLLYNSLALAGLAILGVDPQQIFNAGFQLSFLSVFFIAWLFPKIHPSVARFRVSHAVTSSLVISLSAWLGTAPLIAATFRNFSPVTVLANMAVVPLAMLVLTAGFALVFIGAIFPGMAYFIAVANDFLIFLLLETNRLLSQLPWASFKVPPLPWQVVVAYYVLIFLLFNLQTQKGAIKL